MTRDMNTQNVYIDLVPRHSMTMIARFAIEPVMLAYLSTQLGVPLGCAILGAVLMLFADARRIYRHALRRGSQAFVRVRVYRSGEIVFNRRDGQFLHAQVEWAWWDLGVAALAWRPIDFNYGATAQASRQSGTNIEYIGPEAFSADAKRRFSVFIGVCRRG